MKEIVIKNHTISSKKVTICVPITAVNEQTIIDEINLCILNKVSMVELRADFYEHLFDDKSLLGMLEHVSGLCPDIMLLFTIRTMSEGGNIDISDDEYIRILNLVADSGLVDLIDVEMFSHKDRALLIRKLQAKGAKVIASHHNFDKTYDDDAINDYLIKMYNSNADIVKIAMMPQSEDDVVRTLYQLNLFNKKHDCILIAISMGKYGKTSRICGGLFGSAVTFSPVTKSSAPGQIDYKTMSQLLETIEE